MSSDSLICILLAFLSIMYNCVQCIRQMKSSPKTAFDLATLELEFPFSVNSYFYTDFIEINFLFDMDSPATYITDQHNTLLKMPMG